ncbi:MAG: hypothetical protein V1748_10520 [Actinomycetota bacterium]
MRTQMHHRAAGAACLVAALCAAVLLPAGCGLRGTRPGNDPDQPLSQRAAEELLQREARIEGYYSYVDLPEMTLDERLRLAAGNKARGQTFANEQNSKAQALSDELEEYVRGWLRGEVPARLPAGLLPDTIDTPKTCDWTLVRPEDVDPDKQWYAIPSHPLDPNFERCHMIGSEAHITYEKLIYIAPIGSKLLIEGDFPHARYMSYEILPPFDPDHPASGTMGETPEVPLVDADIEPDPGSTNPFRVGADRTASPRHYHVSFDLALGNAVRLNGQAMKNPEYRAPGNNRIGAPFGFAGAWGGNALTPSVVWLRIYAPDKNVDARGGVGFPKAMLQLETGERFWLQPDFSLAAERQNSTTGAGYAASEEPPASMGPQLGWFKIFGLAMMRPETVGYHLQAQPYGREPSDAVKARIRQAFLLLFNRGESAEPPGGYEACATACTNDDYLTRIFQLGPGKVYVITGRMPVFPETRGGEPVMTGGEVRYWSIAQYGTGEDNKDNNAVNYGALMDDEVVTGPDRDYVIAYSREEDRPENATAENGVTWADWGPRSRQTITIRWMNVMPEWHLPQYAPDEYNCPWAKADWAATQYDAALVGRNSPGVMGPYHPVIHYMTKQEFESLGDGWLAPADIPEWN